MQGQHGNTINETRGIIDFKTHLNQFTFEPERAVLKMQVLLMHCVDVRVVLLSCLDGKVDIRCWNKGAAGPAAGSRLFTFRKEKAV